MNAVIAAAILSLAVQQQAGDRFNLVCVGTQSTTTTPERHWEDRIRVDLGANLFCWRNCTYRAEIYKITDGEIFFTNASGVTKVNRITGQFSSIETAPGEGFRQINGRCTRADYTPITLRAF